jgi:hypothetical protein
MLLSLPVLFDEGAKLLNVKRTPSTLPIRPAVAWLKPS